MGTAWSGLVMPATSAAVYAIAPSVKVELRLTHGQLKAVCPFFTVRNVHPTMLLQLARHIVQAEVDSR